MATGGRGGGKSNAEDTTVVDALGNDKLPPDVLNGTTATSVTTVDMVT